VWTVDPSLFFTEKNYEKSFPIPRLNATTASPAPTAPVKPAKPSALPRSRSNISSRRNLPIVGREKDLEDILRVLSKPEKESVLVLHGHSGAGKSELAKEFARRNASRYPGGTFLLDATAGALDVDFARIGKTLLGLNSLSDLSVPEQGQQTFYSLGSVPTLLIYDNVGSVDGVNAWLQSAGMACHVLMTSTIDTWDGWQAHEVKPLRHEESLELIKALGGSEVAEKYGEQLASLAGGLPIQICPAAITLAHEQRRGRLDSARISLVPEADESFRLVYDRLEDPVRLLLHSAVLFNQRIPRGELSTQLQKALGWSETDFEKRLDACFDLHLLEGASELKMHQLFVRFLQATPLAEAQAELLKKVRTVQAERFIELAKEVHDYPNRTDLASTLIAFPLAPTAWDEFGASIAFGDGEWIGGALSGIGRFDEARPWFERAVAAKEKGDTEGRVDHNSLSSSLHLVGWCLLEAGKYGEARSWYERALTEAEKDEKQGSVDHSRISASLHEIGRCISATGNHAEACPWFERAVAEEEKGAAEGRINPNNLGKSLTYVGYCLLKLGRHDEARSWHKRAVEAKAKGNRLGCVDHESLGNSQHWVGYCLAETGNYAEALPWYERSVAAKEKGDVHGRVNYESLGISLHQVGVCLSEIGKDAEALPYFERARAAKRKGDIFGKVDRETVARSLAYGAECLRKLGKGTEAEAWEKEAAELGSSGDS
jgi:tetratricopeptide (TPR) repeat protein